MLYMYSIGVAALGGATFRSAQVRANDDKA